MALAQEIGGRACAGAVDIAARLLLRRLTDPVVFDVVAATQVYRPLDPPPLVRLSGAASLASLYLIVRNDNAVVAPCQHEQA